NAAETAGVKALENRRGVAGKADHVAESEHLLAAAVAPLPNREILGEVDRGDRKDERPHRLFKSQFQLAAGGRPQVRIAGIANHGRSETGQKTLAGKIGYGGRRAGRDVEKIDTLHAHGFIGAPQSAELPADCDARANSAFGIFEETAHVKVPTQRQVKG